MDDQKLSQIPEDALELNMVSGTYYTSEQAVDNEKSDVLKNGGVDNTAFTGNRGSISKEDPSEKLIVQSKKKFRISYEVVFWFFFIVSMILCILDRFFGNGDITLGRSSKIVSRMWGTRVGETILNLIWGFTARLMTVTENTMLYTMLWIIPNMLLEYAPSWLDVSNIRDVHVRIHRITGIYLIAIPTLIHVNSIFIPPIIDKTNLTLYHIPFNRHNWSLIWDPAAIPGWSFNDQYGVHLTNDEVFRYANNMVLFLVIFPLTRSNFLNSRSYSFAIGLHVFAGIWHILDNVRKISHGLNHWYNVPMMFIWGIDRFVSIYFYRKCSAAVASRKVIGKHEYVELRLKTSKSYESGFGDIYYFLQDKRGVNGRLNPERSHPFTTYSNHSADRSWDIGLIINVMDDKLQWHPAWTRVCCNFEAWDADPVKLRAWGPYRSSVWELHNQLNTDQPCLLLASGSGYGYLMDVLGYLAFKKDNKENTVIPQVDIHYTVRCHAFLKHYRSEIDSLLNEIESKNTADVRFNWYCTKEQDAEDNIEVKKPLTKINEVNRRINFDKLFSNAPKYTQVYFVGNPSLTKHIESICEKYNLPFIRDYTNGTFPKSDKKTMMRYLTYLIKFLFSAVSFLFLLSIYVKAE